MKIKISRYGFLVRFFSLTMVFSALVFCFCVSRITLAQNDVNADGLPSRFDLRDVNGENYVTPLKNQGDRGICWAFATIASFESSLMKQGLVSTSNPQIFSEYQLDFALSSDGMDGFSLDYGVIGFSLNDRDRELADKRALENGGFDASWFLSSGYAPMLLSEFGEDKYDITPVVPEEVLSGNVEYYIADYDELRATENEDKITVIKKHLMQNGAVHVATKAPRGNQDIIVQDYPYEMNHGMTLIGWDDGYEYVRNGVNEHGAWILKNSWGDVKAYPYLSYSSTDVAYFHGSESVKKRVWDKAYTNLDKTSENGVSVGVNGYSSYDVYFAKFEGLELLKELNFRNGIVGGGEYDVYISRTGKEEDFELIRTVTDDLPGSISVDDINVPLNLGRFAVRIVGKNGALISSIPNVNVFTVEDEYPLGPTVNLAVLSDVYSYSRTMNMGLYVSNIDSEEVEIVFYDEDETQIDIFKEISKTKIGNRVYYEFEVDNESCTINCLTDQKYIARALRNGEPIFDSEISVNIVEPVSNIGDGTTKNPFIITTAEQLMKIGTNDVYMGEGITYKLGKNIDFSDYLTTHSFHPIGSDIYDRDTGQGIFRGVLDGGGYEISGIYSDGGVDGTALFQYIGGGKVVNLTLRNINFVDQSKVAALSLIADSVIVEDFYVVDSVLEATGEGGRASSVFDSIITSGWADRVYSSAELVSGGLDGEACGYACAAGYQGGAFWFTPFLEDFVFVGKLSGEHMYLIGDEVNLKGNNFDFELDSFDAKYDFHGDIKNIDNVSGSQFNLGNVFIYIRPGQSDFSDIIRAYNDIGSIKNFYVTDGEGLFDGENYVGDAGSSGLINMGLYNKSGFYFTELINCSSVGNCWNYSSGRPRLDRVDYDRRSVSIGTSKKYVIDTKKRVVSNVKLYKTDNRITKGQLADNFEYFEGEIYESDGVTLAMDDESRIKTNMLIKNGDGVYTISVVGDLNGDGRVNPSDVIILRRYIAGGYGIEFNEAQKLAADVNQDGTVGVSDVIQLRRGIAGGYGNDHMIYDMEGN